MRIGVVTTSYPRWRGDSAGVFVERHAQALRELGHEVEVVAAGDGEVDDRVELRESARRESERRAQQLALHEVDLREAERRGSDRRGPASDDQRAPIVVHRRVAAPGLFYDGGAPDALERDPLRALLAAATFVPRFAARVAWHARQWDHVIAHWLPSALAALPARKPLTAIAHGGDIYTLRRMRMLGPALAALRGARLVVVSEELRAIAGRGVVQPMGLDLAHFRSLGRAPNNTILVAARLVPIKGVDTAIEAMQHLPTNLRLVIAGDGPERRALEARARHARVTFVGHVDTHVRDQLLREASVVVVPSRAVNGRREGCPTIALEALAANVPVVATIGRATETVASDDPRALAAAITRAIASTEKHYERVADLDWRDVAARLLRSE